MRQFEWKLCAAALAIAWASCAAASAAGSKGTPPVTLEVIAGSEVKRMTLTDMAFRRLEISTADVLEELAARSRRVGGTVVDLQPASDGSGGMTGIISIAGLPGSAAKCAESSRVLPMAEYDWSRAMDGRLIAASAVPASATQSEPSTYYTFTSPSGFSQPAARMLVEVCSPDSENILRIVPHASLLFANDGRTWVYVAEGPHTFVRTPVTLAWIHGDRAFLTEGPAPGVRVVVAGSVELFGEELGIGK
jgi:hypothetical protein